MAGYTVTIGRRYGGHGGVATEWEFSVPSGDPYGIARLKALAALNHPGLNQFLLDDVCRANYSFNVLQDEYDLSGLCFRYLTAWPDELNEYLAEVEATIPRVGDTNAMAKRRQEKGVSE